MAANPRLSAVTGPQAGRQTGRMRNSLLNLASKSRGGAALRPVSAPPSPPPGQGQGAAPLKLAGARTTGAPVSTARPVPYSPGGIAQPGGVQGSVVPNLGGVVGATHQAQNAAAGGENAKYNASNPTGELKQFAQMVLRKIGAPVTKENLALMAAWAQAEGGHENGARYNWFNTTQGMPGSTDFNSVPVQSYGSLRQGVAATAKTLTNGNYDMIVKLLRQSANPIQVARAIKESPWGTGAGVLNVLRS